MFVGVHALVIGLIGARWRLAHGGAPASARPEAGSARPISIPTPFPDRRLTLDLLEISRKLWRYRIVTLPVIAMTLLGALYVVAVKGLGTRHPPSYVLINPPAPPTAEDIARNPALASIDPDNPYTRFTDQSVVVGLLSSRLNSESTRRELKAAGADPRYTVAPNSDFGFSSLLMEITGTGSSSSEAVRTAELVGTALTRELESLQASQGVAPRYRIQTQRVVAPIPERRLSGTLRALVGLLALGAILLFVVVSAAEGLATLRAERGDGYGPTKKGKGDSRRSWKRLTGQLTRLSGASSRMASVGRSVSSPSRKDGPGKGGNGHPTDLAGTTEALAAARAERGEGNGTDPKDNGDSVDSTAKNASTGREQEPRRRRRRAGSKA